MNLTVEQKQKLILNYRQLNAEEKQFIRELMASPARSIVLKLFGADIDELLKMIPMQVQNMQAGGMAKTAQNLAAQGRGGDTMLVHMSPEEVRGLRGLAMRMGTDLTVNPKTGLTEALKLRDFAPILPFLPIPGMNAILPSLGAKAVASGVIGGLTSGKGGFDFKRGVQTGLMAYGLGSAYNAMNPTAPIGAPPAGTGTGVGGAGATTTAGTVSGQYGGVDIGSQSAANLGYIGDYPFPSTSSPVAALPPPTVPEAAKAATTASAPAKEVSKFEKLVGVSPELALIGGNLAYGAYQAGEERQLAQQQIAAIQAEQERKRREALLAFENSLGRVQQPVYGASGGIVAFAKGGMPTFEYGGTTAPTGEPRMVQGAGDGMSDNVPANIEGVQEARLANDEFVVPADVVADIGNGSSNAGAKKLYAMMDRVRKARHGTTEQPPEIDAERLMPA